MSLDEEYRENFLQNSHQQIKDVFTYINTTNTLILLCFQQVFQCIVDLLKINDAKYVYGK